MAAGVSGEPTGEALRMARADIRATYPRETTWAGYVLYGDPTFRLTETDPPTASV
jgi:hypothetical protein